METKQEITVQRGEQSLKREFDILVYKIFAPEFSIGTTIDCIEGDGGVRCDNVGWTLVKKYRKPFIGLFKTSQLQAVVIGPTGVSNPQNYNGEFYEANLQIYSGGMYHPIDIHVHLPEAMDKAKQFAKEYQSLTNLEAKVLQEY